MDALIGKTVMQGGRSFSFRLDPKQSVKKLLKNSQWYDYACGYSRSADGSVHTVNLHLKDSTRMLLGYKDPEYRKLLGSRELSALGCLEARLAKLIAPGMSQADKARAIHDDLVNRVTYDLRSGGECATIILKNSGVCEAYARYMYLALNMAGIDCHIVLGRAGGPHAWNLAKIDGHWYHIDATWDDPVARAPILRHDYFCISDKAIARNHKWNTGAYPAAPELDDIYFRRQKRYFTRYDAFWRAVRAACGAGERTFEAKLAPLGKKGGFAGALRTFCKENPDVRVESFSHSDSDPSIIFLSFAQGPASGKVPQPVERKVSRPEPDDANPLDWIDADIWNNLCNGFDSDNLLEEGGRLLDEGAGRGRQLLDEGAERLKRLREGAAEWWD